MTIIICTFRRREVYTTIEILCLFLKSYPHFDLLVVDNEGSEKLQEFCKEKTVGYVREKVLGLSHARNKGLRVTVDKWVYFLDDDVYVTLEFLEDLNECYEKSDIIFSYVTPSTLPLVDGKLVGGFLASSLSIHGTKISPIGCSFGFFNSGEYRFDERLGRVGRNLAGEEENDLIERMLKDGRSLRLLRGAVVHRIGNKLNMGYIEDYYRNEFASNKKLMKLRILAHISRSFLSRKTTVYRRALVTIFRE